MGFWLMGICDFDMNWMVCVPYGMCHPHHKIDILIHLQILSSNVVCQDPLLGVVTAFGNLLWD